MAQKAPQVGDTVLTPWKGRVGILQAYPPGAVKFPEGDWGFYKFAQLVVVEAAGAEEVDTPSLPTPRTAVAEVPSPALQCREGM